MMAVSGLLRRLLMPNQRLNSVACSVESSDLAGEYFRRESASILGVASCVKSLNYQRPHYRMNLYSQGTGKTGKSVRF